MFSEVGASSSILCELFVNDYRGLQVFFFCLPFLNRRQVLCYVATGFGQTDVETVKQDVDKYEQLYPGLCGGFFFDEGANTEEFAYKCEK